MLTQIKYCLLNNVKNKLKKAVAKKGDPLGGVHFELQGTCEGVGETKLLFL